MQGAIIDGRWALLQSIGKGGMGEVFMARHTTLETTVALKLLKPELSQDTTIREKMIIEAKAAAKVKHPNVVLVTDVGQTKDGVVFIVMEHVDGNDLKTLLEREGPLAIDRARSLLTQISRGLAAAHTNKVIHRDVKPANCVVARADDGHEVVKILDFGIAKILEDNNDTAKESPMTNRWFSRHYVAPEIERGHSSDERSDVYSFGVLAYRMLTGHYPYEKSFKAITPPDHYRPDIPCDLCELIRDALRPDPDDRPSSMSRVCQRLVSEAASYPSEPFDPSDSLGGKPSPSQVFTDTAPEGVEPPRSPNPLVGWGRWALLLGAVGIISVLTSSSPWMLRQPVIVSSAIPTPPVEQDLPPTVEVDSPTETNGTSGHERPEVEPAPSSTATVPPAQAPSEALEPPVPAPRGRPPRDGTRRLATNVVSKCLDRGSADRCFDHDPALRSDRITIWFSVRNGWLLSPKSTTTNPQIRECIHAILRSCVADELPSGDKYKVRVRP